MFAFDFSILFHANCSPKHFPFSSRNSQISTSKSLNYHFILPPFRCLVLLTHVPFDWNLSMYRHTMAMPKAGSTLAGHQKDKQRAYEHPLTNARTVSCDGDSTKIRPLHHNSPFKPRYSDQAGKSDMTDRSNPPDDLPQLTLNEDEPLPPPEITSASVMAVTRLKNTMSDLLDAINYYEEFDGICRGTHFYCKSDIF